MNEQQAHDVVYDYPTRVVARDAHGGVYGEGVAFSYSIVPVIGIRYDDGREIHWRHDLCDIKETD